MAVVSGSIRPKDITWVRSIFGVAPAVRDRRLRNLRLFSNVQTSFADTTMGGNQAINAPHQFSLMSDPPQGGLFANPKNRGSDGNYAWYENEKAAGSYRLGTYYFDAIENNSFYLHLRFGKPKYIGSFAFFANMYDSNIAHLARTGNYTAMIRSLASYATAFAIYAAIGIVNFAVLLLIPRVVKAVLNKPVSRYYYVKPTMHLYLRATQNIVNSLLLHYRMVPMTALDFMGKRYKDINDPDNRFFDEREELYSLLPDIWKSNGEFDIYKMVNRYQVLANYQARTLDNIYAEATDDKDLEARLEAFYSTARYTAALREVAQNRALSLAQLEEYHSKASESFDDGDVDADSAAALMAMQSRYNEEFTSGGDVQAQQQADEINQIVQDKVAQGDGSKTVGDLFGNMLDSVTGLGKSFTQQMLSELRDGGQWVTWRINGKDSVSKSWSNTTKEPEISTTVNSLTSKARSLEVSTSAGQTGIDFADAAISGLKSAMSGALDTLHLTGLLALYNSSVVDFPEVWDGASMSGDDFTFTIQLRSDGGTDADIVQDLMIPSAFWIASVCPLATGKQSYTHPFYLEAYSRGRCAIRNGIVTNLTLTMGVGNQGWRTDGAPLGIDISVTIRDLSRAMYMPIVTDPSVWDDSNKFSDFIATMGNVSLHERVYGLEKAIFNFNKWKMSWKSAFTVGNVGAKVGNSPPARVLAGLLGGTAR